MTKKQHTIYGIIGMIIGIIGGIAGTAFSMGAGQQQFRDTLFHNTTAIEKLQTDNITAIEKLQTYNTQSRESSQKEIDRYIKTVTTRITDLHNNISRLTDTVIELRTDVHVLKALIQRIEKHQSINTNGT